MQKIFVTRLTPALGAEIAGFDFRTSPDAFARDSIYKLLLDHQVIFFRDQEMSPENHVALAESFGEVAPPHAIYPHLPDFPSVVVLNFNGGEQQDTNVWHTDLTFQGSPPFASVLYSRVVPKVGGDTLWASMTAAYDALPDGMKSEINELRAVHDMSDFRNNFTVGEPEGDAARLNEAHKRMGSAIHPLVKYHPATGRPHLFCNPGFTMHVEGLSSADSRRLLAYLFDHMTQPEFQIRFRWSENAVAIWDNQCTIHYALGDYGMAQRVMHRVTVENDRRLES